MKAKKKSLQEIFYVLILLAATIVLFHWYATQNASRMEERNKNYAADSAQLKAVQIDEEFNHARNLISTYSYFIGESLSEPKINLDMLGRIEDEALFDTIVFTDLEGINHSSDGRTSSAAGRDYYVKGVRGESGISVIFDSDLYDETMFCFYAPLRYKGDIIGVLRGAYLAEEYLKNMLGTTYFGESAVVYLCMPDGMIIASSDENIYKQNFLLEELWVSGTIDKNAAEKVRGVFEHGGEGSFLCTSDSGTDNICVKNLPSNQYVLVQTFPKNVTQSMIRAENLVGFRLEVMLIGMFVIYITALIIRAGRDKKMLEHENLEMGYIINGVTTLFSRFSFVDLEEGTYQYLAGTKPESDLLAPAGRYEDLTEYLCASMVEESEREEFAEQIRRDMIVKSMADRDDLRYECHVRRAGRMEWDHRRKRKRTAHSGRNFSGRP